MTPFRFAVLAFGFLFAVSGPARADDAADARAIVEKAIQAHGGRDTFEKFQGYTSKLKGLLYGLGKSVLASSTATIQGADQMRLDMEVDIDGETASLVIVING